MVVAPGMFQPTQPPVLINGLVMAPSAGGYPAPNPVPPQYAFQPRGYGYPGGYQPQMGYPPQPSYSPNNHIMQIAQEYGLPITPDQIPQQPNITLPMGGFNGPMTPQVASMMWQSLQYAQQIMNQIGMAMYQPGGMNQLFDNIFGNPMDAFNRMG